MRKTMRPDQAAQLVTNALGRVPQDDLEAAVVLEAWGGARTTEGLQLGSDANRAGYPDGPISDPQDLKDGGPFAEDTQLSEEMPGRAGASIAVLVAIVAMAVWAVPLSEAYGDSAVAAAWRLALPATLALQSWFVVRHSSQGGLGSLPGHRLEYVLVSLVAAGTLSLFPAPEGPLAVLFLMTWSTGAVLVQRGWFVGFASANVAVAVALLAGAKPAMTLGIAMIGMVIAASVATLRHADLVVAGPNARAVLAGTTGMLLGVLLVIDPSVQWDAAGYLPVLALVPALVGNVWAATYLSRIWVELPRFLLSHPAAVGPMGVGSLASTVIWGALLRFVGAALPLSLIAAAIISQSGVPMRRVTLLLLGFGIVMVASLGIVLLDVFGRRIRAFLAAGFGLAAAMVVVVIGVPSYAGAALMLGALVSLGLAVKPIVAALTRPDRAFATAMLLP